MTLARESRPPQRGLNVFAPELLQDPYPWYAEMRQLGVFDYALPQIPNARAVMLSHWADVQNVLRDARFGRAGFRQNVISTIGEGALADSYAQWFLFQDPPDHTRLRGLVSKAFTPRTIAAVFRSGPRPWPRDSTSSPPPTPRRCAAATTRPLA